jgi:hypothetical protein
MTVTFSTDGTLSLDGLHVSNVQAKNYTPDTLPYWGIEKANSSKYMIEDIYLFWGLVNESYAYSPDLEVQRAHSVYLPAANHATTLAHIYDSFAAGGAFQAAWESVYEHSGSVRGAEQDFIPR